MTVVVAFYCTDGVVIAADSMITPRIGNIGIGHRKGKKVHIMANDQVFAFAGDPGQASRFRVVAEALGPAIAGRPHPLLHPLDIANNVHAQFQASGIADKKDLATVLAFSHGGTFHCCVFEGQVQPRLLDAAHYFTTFGSGALSAEPFLGFVTNVFCTNGQPSVRDAVFLATWVVQHVIDTNPGGVAGPICVCAFESNGAGGYSARELPDTEIAEHQQAIQSAGEALRTWLQKMQSGEAGEEVEAPPTLGAA
jgi:hypothetical protein